MTHYDEYYHWQKARELYDPHKYDYLHAEGPNAGEFEGWRPRDECTCDACFVASIIHDGGGELFESAYTRMKQIMEDFPELDRIDAFNVYIGEIFSQYQV